MNHRSHTQSLSNETKSLTAPTSNSHSGHQLQNYCAILSNSLPKQTVLLSTTKVENFQTARVVLDSGSQANFITQKCLNQLGLKKKKISISIQGLNEASTATSGITNCVIRPVGKTEPIFSFHLLVLPKHCINMPIYHINTSS